MTTKTCPNQSGCERLCKAGRIAASGLSTTGFPTLFCLLLLVLFLCSAMLPHLWLLPSFVPPGPMPLELPTHGSHLMPGCQLVAHVCLDMLLPRLPLVYSFGFFSLNSIAYRRVIRVYQYEVGDDLSGRFFSSYFSSSLTVVLPMHSGLPGGSAF